MLNSSNIILYANHFYLIIAQAQHSNYLASDNYTFIIFSASIKRKDLKLERNNPCHKSVKKGLSVWRSQNDCPTTHPYGTRKVYQALPKAFYI